MYFCEICNYKTDNKSKLHLHHIIPKELNGSSSVWNLIYLCPTCHTNVFIPESKHGNHSIKSSNSIIIIGKKFSTYGNILIYIDKYSNEIYKEIKNENIN